MSDSASSDRIELTADENWKERVRDEARQLDEQRKTEEASGQASQAPSDEDLEFLPPASFAMLVQMFSTQAIVALGLVPDPQTRQTTPRPRLARHFIDLLGVLEAKTRGQLTRDEEQLLTANLHELRMAYVECSRQAMRDVGESPPNP
jgi:hypothetical protein